MLKIAIITFYDAYNYGAFWQARCLKDFVNDIEGINCDMLKIELRKDNLKPLKCVYDFFRGRMSWAKMIFEIKRYSKFQIFSKRLNPQPKDNFYDIYVFGSDELWNIKRKQNRGNKAKILWGIGLSDVALKISYAPSINEAQGEDFALEPLFKENVYKFSALSARDQKSIDVLEKILDRKVELVLDPTLLQRPEYFRKYQPKKTKERKKYLLLYTYDVLLTEKEISRIKSFAKDKSLKIVSLGNYIDFADESILCTPEQFLMYFQEADYVFTNTFHGTMFSIIYRKNCGILDSHQSKVDEAISQFGLEKLQVSDLDDLWNMDDRNLKMIWNEVYETVEEYRKKSETYLLEAIHTEN